MKELGRDHQPKCFKHTHTNMLTNFFACKELHNSMVVSNMFLTSCNDKIICLFHLIA